MGRASSIAKVVGINVAGLALALVGAEIALRIVKPEALQARLKMNELMRQGPAQAQGLFAKHSTSNPTVGSQRIPTFGSARSLRLEKPLF